MAPRRRRPGRPATVDDVHDIAMALPEVTHESAHGARGVYKVHGKGFVFFRGPRPDALDAQTGERLTDVIGIMTPGPSDKEALVEDERSPFFTTPHFDGYNAVLVRESRLGELDREELAEVITDAWLARAPKRVAAAYLAELPPP